MEINQKRQLFVAGRLVYETPKTSVRSWAGSQVLCTSPAATGIEAEDAIIDYIDD